MEAHLSDADFLCMRVTFTCQRDWACLGRAGGMGFVGKDLFLMTAVMMTTLNALRLWGRIPRETETKPEAGSSLPRFPTLSSLCLHQFLGVMHVHFTGAVKDNPP